MYKNNPLDDIVKYSVDISSPASGDAAFDTILLVVPAPSSEGKEIAKAIVISKADELLDYGYAVSDSAYKAATVAFAQNPAPSELYVCVRGSEDGVYEDIRATLARAASEAEFYGISITEFESDAEDVENTMEWTEANEKLFGFSYTDFDNFPAKNTSYYRTFAVYSGNADGYGEEQPDVNKYAALAWMAKCFGYDPGTETWNMKELASVVPSALSGEQKKSLKNGKINTYLRYAGSNVMIGGYVLAGEWIDVIRFRDWLKNEMQMNVFNAIKVNRKVPFTDNGIGMIEGAMERTLKEGQDIGGIALTEYDNNDNEIPGFKVTVPKAADLTEAERKSRVLTGCRYTARLAGAIHVVEIEGYLSF